MSDLINKWLYDILESINSINEYIGDQKYFDIYENNKQLRRSVEREIEIIIINHLPFLKIEVAQMLDS